MGKITIKACDKQAPVALTTLHHSSLLDAFLRLGLALGKLAALAEHNARQIAEVVRHG